jgi:uncharacterized protein YutE (UPF0331/DUF86 family)
MLESARRPAAVVLRVDAVEARLLRLEEILSELEELAKLPPETLRVSLQTSWAVERGLQVGAEIVFDISNHILSGHFGVSPEGYEDILGQLASRGVLSADLRSRLKGLGGFRNILVHDYLRIDPEQVAEALLRAPRDLGDFGREVRGWLEQMRRQE